MVPRLGWWILSTKILGFAVHPSKVQQNNMKREKKKGYMHIKYRNKSTKFVNDSAGWTDTLLPVHCRIGQGGPLGTLNKAIYTTTQTNHVL